MRKLLLAAFSVSLLCTVIPPAFAQSGCCSWHGGVSMCAADGYDLCNDGTESPTCTCSGGGLTGLASQSVHDSSQHLLDLGVPAMCADIPVQKQTYDSLLSSTNGLIPKLMSSNGQCGLQCSDAQGAAQIYTIYIKFLNDNYKQFCSTYGQSCQNQYGSNSYGDGTNCNCTSGYQFNSTKTYCVKVPTYNSDADICGSNAVYTSIGCKCMYGYVKNNYNVCVPYQAPSVSSSVRSSSSSSSSSVKAAVHSSRSSNLHVTSSSSSQQNIVPCLASRLSTCSCPISYRANRKQCVRIPNR
jgi:hypothetical protein